MRWVKGGAEANCSQYYLVEEREGEERGSQYYFFAVYIWEDRCGVIPMVLYYD